jgi:uncharacterized protein (DUF1330 family)
MHLGMTRSELPETIGFSFGQAQEYGVFLAASFSPTAMEHIMSVYWLARAKIIDPVEYRKYNEAARQVWHKYPRKILARGGRYEVLEGKTQYERFVVAEYESFDVAKAYFNSPEYQAAAEFRRRRRALTKQLANSE